MALSSRSPFASIIVLGILAFATGCDKDRARREAANAVRPAGTTAIDITRRPTLLFQLFGDRSDPRVLPVAAIIDSTVVAIGLNEQGWRALDSLYFAPGTSLPLYRGGQSAGTATVTRGMWTKEGVLQELPGCATMRPLAAARLSSLGATSAVELLGTSAPLTTRPAAPFAMPQGEVNKVARAMGREVASRHGMEPAELDSLDFSARALATGASSGPTLVLSIMDSHAGDLGPGAGHTTSLLALGEQVGGTWQATYRHVSSGNARTVEFQRFVDHLDLDGDGIDEVLVESWRYAGDDELVVLRFKAGQWHESLRAPLGWCLDSRPASGKGRR